MTSRAIPPTKVLIEDRPSKVGRRSWTTMKSLLRRRRASPGHASVNSRSGTRKSMQGIMDLPEIGNRGARSARRSTPRKKRPHASSPLGVLQAGIRLVKLQILSIARALRYAKGKSLLAARTVATLRTVQPSLLSQSSGQSGDLSSHADPGAQDQSHAQAEEAVHGVRTAPVAVAVDLAPSGAALHRIAALVTFTGDVAGVGPAAKTASRALPGANRLNSGGSFRSGTVPAQAPDRTTTSHQLASPRKFLGTTTVLQAPHFTEEVGRASTGDASGPGITEARSALAASVTSAQGSRADNRPGRPPPPLQHHSPPKLRNRPPILGSPRSLRWCHRRRTVRRPHRSRRVYPSEGHPERTHRDEQCQEALLRAPEHGQGSMGSLETRCKRDGS